MSHGLPRFAAVRFASLLALAPLAALAAGCAPPEEEDAAVTGEANLESRATLSFGADWRVEAAGSLTRGARVAVTYDVSRLPDCRGDLAGGKPGWNITGFAKQGSKVQSFHVAGYSPTGESAETPSFVVDRAGPLEVWFQSNSRWGCNAYDSALGANYRFDVGPDPKDPGYVGNARYALDRQTCDGRVCDGSLRPVDGEILYEGWARQRAAIRTFTFEAWKEGVTDFDNADLWKTLDVQVHTRLGGEGAFTSRYVDFDKRLGNNARYALDLRALDPLDVRATVQRREDCPVFPMQKSADGASVEVVLELYATVNGVELRPGEGATYRVRYRNDAAIFPACTL